MNFFLKPKHRKRNTFLQETKQNIGNNLKEDQKIRRSEDQKIRRSEDQKIRN